MICNEVAMPLLMLLGHITGNLDHLSHPAMLFYREIGRLQPDRLASLAQTREDPGFDPPLLELSPELLVIGRLGQRLAAKHPVMLTLQLCGAVTHQNQKWLVGLQDTAVRRKDDGSDTTLDGIDKSLQFGELRLAGLQLRLQLVIEHECQPLC
jgi:hypothetical protein